MDDGAWVGGKGGGGGGSGWGSWGFDIEADDESESSVLHSTLYKQT